MRLSLKVFIVINILFLAGIKQVFADVLDSSSNGYLGAVVLGVKSFPDSNSDIPDSIYYDESIVVGESSSIIKENYSSDMFLDIETKRRIPSVLDKVVGPPGTKIDFLYFYKNHSGENIFLEDVWMSFSRNERNDGDISKLLDISEVSAGTILAKWGNIVLYRYGVGKKYVLDTVIPANGVGFVVLDTAEIKKSLKIDHWEINADYENNKLDIEVWLQNMTGEYLNDVVFQHGEYSYTQDVLPNDEVVYEYFLERDINKEEDMDLGNIKITDPNTSEECAVNGNRWYQYYYTNAISSHSYSNNSWYVDSFVQPTRQSMCVQRLPYMQVSQNIVLQTQERVDNNVDNEDSNVENKELTEAVLGMQEELLEQLPKTSSNYLGLLLCLLVGEGYLWYSLFKKRGKYEDKNKSARLCTKSSNCVR